MENLRRADSEQTPAVPSARLLHLGEFGGTVFIIAAGFVVTALIILLNGFNPVLVFYRAFRGALFTRIGLLQSLSGTTPLLLTAITFAIGYRCGLFNIGAEGSMLMGAAATIAAGALIRLPPVFHHAVVTVSAMLGGMIWSIPAAFLKTKRQVHEVVSTIMMNWTALFLMGFLVSWPLRDLSVAFGTYAVEILPSARFPILVQKSPLTGVLFIGIAAAFVAYLVMWHTRTGQHIRATGYNIDAARTAAINTPLMMIASFAIGGASAGLAGCALTAGTPPLWTVTEGLSSLKGIGFLGIAVAMIGRNHPVWSILSAFFISTMRTARFYIQQAGVAPELTDIMTGVIVFFFALPEAYRMLVRHTRTRASKRGAPESAETVQS